MARARRLSVFVLTMLVLEFLDEFAYSGLEAARPLIRDAFALSYVGVGLVTTVPVLVAILVEPVVGLFEHAGNRRALVVAGGVAFGLGLVVQGLAPSFAVFLLGATLQAPASGVFVNLAQASLMDDAPTRRENRMALWTLSGSVAVVVGPLSMAGLITLGVAWRAYFVGAGLVSILAALWASRFAYRAAGATDADDEAPPSLRDSVRAATELLRRADIWRWLALLQFSDLMLDVLFGLLALYLVDVAGLAPGRAGLAVVVWTGVGLLGDFLLIPLLERVRGLAYLRVSAWATLALYPAFLLVEPLAPKLVLLGLVGLFNAGWYAILQGKLYDALGEQSGAVLIVGNAAGVFGAVLPVLLGLLATQVSLTAAMWALAIGPLALAVGLPRAQMRNDDN